MKKNAILYILLVFLIVVNGFFLYNYMGLSRNDRPKGQQRDKDFIVKELNFNAAQLEEFNEKNKGHHQTIKNLSDEVKVLKDYLFSMLSNDSINPKIIDSITSLVCEKETAKEKETFYHFKMIHNISNEKQKEKFKSILFDALRQGDNANRPLPPNMTEGHRPPPRP
ncbi:hypothetical protein [Winogradskyella sediminis]|uniref:Heavy-metal resistance n=1 Tax=Winogradskyella sediminis TaxID=1382466 RepID=A0A1H1N919_9FLAO|nr:hypothetical protein [Winogradskyella sediminis]SDR95503.1 hypothetical protein SAMN04489797_0540 [Winogradskyella sediminis]